MPRGASPTLITGPVAQSQPVHITYSSIGVRDLCECGTISVRRLGSENAALLQQVLADLHAADSIRDLPPLYGVTLEGVSLAVETDEGLKISGIVRTPESDSSKQAIKIETVTCGE